MLQVEWFDINDTIFVKFHGSRGNIHNGGWLSVWPNILPQGVAGLGVCRAVSFVFKFNMISLFVGLYEFACNNGRNVRYGSAIELNGKLAGFAYLPDRSIFVPY